MLREILKRELCAECRLCCKFDRYDMWETPSLTPAEARAARAVGAELIAGDGIFRFDMGQAPDSGVVACPALGERGCVLGEQKPFECAIWPFRVMRQHGEPVLAVSRLCEPVCALPLSRIYDFAARKILPAAADYARDFPAALKPFDPSYVLLAFC